jgi:hypothetical protein
VQQVRGPQRRHQCADSALGIEVDGVPHDPFVGLAGLEAAHGMNGKALLDQFSQAVPP